jgi:3',5'-cyclic AMP phosphodiesterase CpdA
VASDELNDGRRRALKCMAAGGGTLFMLAGGVLTPVGLALAADEGGAARPRAAGRPLFVQISDTHIGFAKDANPDVNGTLTKTIEQVNALPQQPDLVLHTGDISHLSKPAELDTAQMLLSQLKVRELHTVPGEHDVLDSEPGAEYFQRFGTAAPGKGWYSFDHAGVHFVALNNVMTFKAGELALLGPEQLAWVKDDLKGRSASTPLVVFAHIPLWTIYQDWGWGTGDAADLAQELKRFGSVTVLNGHIHQIVQKVEGHITYHTARSTAFPQPQAGTAPGPGPLKVTADELPHMLGMTSVSIVGHPRSLALTDSTLG